MSKCYPIVSAGRQTVRKKGKFVRNDSRIKNLKQFTTKHVENTNISCTESSNSDENSQLPLTNLEGSRIVDINLLQKQLLDGCTVCGELLNIVNIEEERKIGLSNLWKIR